MTRAAYTHTNTHTHPHIQRERERQKTHNPFEGICVIALECRNAPDRDTPTRIHLTEMYTPDKDVLHSTELTGI